jgi:hypothetical protein
MLLLATPSSADQPFFMWRQTDANETRARSEGDLFCTRADGPSRPWWGIFSCAGGVSKFPRKNARFTVAPPRLAEQHGDDEHLQFINPAIYTPPGRGSAKPQSFFCRQIAHLTLRRTAQDIRARRTGAGQETDRHEQRRDLDKSGAVVFRG